MSGSSIGRTLYGLYQGLESLHCFLVLWESYKYPVTRLVKMVCRSTIILSLVSRLSFLNILGSSVTVLRTITILVPLDSHQH